MDQEFLKVINQFPEIINITKPGKSLICSGKVTDSIINAIEFWYRNYFSKEITLFLPKNVDLESLENVKASSDLVVIFGYADIIFNDLCKNNKRRFNTLLKGINKKSRIIILSNSNLKCLDLNALDSFDHYSLKEQVFPFDFSLIDLLDPEIENYESNVESFIEIISDLSKNNRIYISLNLIQTKIVSLYTKLKENLVSVSKNESETENVVVINSSKTTENTFLKKDYDIYIYILPHIEHPLDLVGYIKDSFGKKCEIYIDSSKIDNVTKCLKAITCTEVSRTIVKDSSEFESYADLVKKVNSEDLVMASDNYYCFEAPECLLKLNLSNLVKKDLDLIRNVIKVKLINKFDLEIKTCQLASPSSPKDRSRKLNSLSNKLSSFDYRCDVTCEIFKDNTIGIVIWNETFANRKTLNINNGIYVYQTTYGKWKYTTIN
jgi:hypothetical protein